MGLEGDTSHCTEALSPRDPLDPLLSMSIPSSAIPEAERCQKNQRAECAHRQKYAKSVILHVLIDLWVNFPLQKKKLEKKIKNQPFQSTGKHPKASNSLRSICSWKNTSALWKHTHTQSELLGFMPRGFLYPPSSRSKILPARGGELSFGSVVKWTKI